MNGPFDPEQRALEQAIGLLRLAIRLAKHHAAAAHIEAVIGEEMKRGWQ